MTWHKKPVTWIILGGVVLVGGFWWRSSSQSQGPFFDTTKVEQGLLKQTVEVTGEIKTDARIGLSFKGSGRIQSLPVKIGTRVKRGQVLASLEEKDAQFNVERAAAALAIARANLNARLAGETKESIQIAQAGVDQAQANYNKAISDLEITKLTVEDEYRVAMLNYENTKKNVENSGATAQQSVDAVYINLRSSLLTALGSLRTSLTDGDAIIGVDDAAANDMYESVLGIFDNNAKERAKNTYPLVKAAVNNAELTVKALTTTSTQAQIKSAAEITQSALQSMQLYLDEVKRVLTATLTNANLTESALASKRATIDTDRANVSGQLSTITSALENIKATELSSKGTKDALQNAYDTAVANLAIADNNRRTKVRQAETALAVQKAALESAQAQLSLKKAPPRDVDVAALRAQVQDAQTAYNQAVERQADMLILAPVDGVITDVIPAVGEQVTQGVVAIRMLGTSLYTVEARVPESDIAKVEPEQSVEITLDAYGDDVKFKGTVLAENDDQTKIQDAIYYNVYIEIDIDGKDVKPGMTANVTVLTGMRENALIIPSRSVRERDGKKYVRIINGATEPKETEITTGLRGDEGRLEVLTGLQKDQQVVVGELSAEEYAKRQTEVQTQ